MQTWNISAPSHPSTALANEGSTEPAPSAPSQPSPWHRERDRAIPGAAISRKHCRVLGQNKSLVIPAQTPFHGSQKCLCAELCLSWGSRETSGKKCFSLAWAKGLFFSCFFFSPFLFLFSFPLFFFFPFPSNSTAVACILSTLQHSNYPGSTHSPCFC